MIYVALLRGINVGGNNKVEMARLREVFSRCGSSNISTYINSGNVIFQDDRSIAELEPIFEAAIKSEFNLSIRVVLRTSENIHMLCEKIPTKWMNDESLKTDVLFLWDEINYDDILQKITYKPEIEKVMYLDGALIWNIARENATKGSSVKLIGTAIYKLMTIRNITTVRKLDSLMTALASGLN